MLAFHRLFQDGSHGRRPCYDTYLRPEYGLRKPVRMESRAISCRTYTDRRVRKHLEDSNEGTRRQNLPRDQWTVDRDALRRLVGLRRNRHFRCLDQYCSYWRNCDRL